MQPILSSQSSGAIQTPFRIEEKTEEQAPTINQGSPSTIPQIPIENTQPKPAASTLDEAKQFMDSIARNRIVHGLSYINFLLIDILKIVNSLHNDIKISKVSQNLILVLENGIAHERASGKQLIQNLLTEIPMICKFLTTYYELSLSDSQLSYKKMIDLAKEKYMVVSQILMKLNAFIEVEGHLETKSNFQKLKNYCGILKYLCFNKEFLSQYGQSVASNMSLQKSLLCHPPTIELLNFYSDSLKVSSESVYQFNQVLQKEITDPLKEALLRIEKLSKEVSCDLAIKNFVEAINSYTTIIKDVVCENVFKVNKVVSDSIHHNCFENLKNCFVNSSSLQQLLMNLSTILPLISKIMVPWNCTKVIFHNFTEQEKNAQNASNQLTKRIKGFEKTLKKSKKKIKAEQFNQFETQIQIIRKVVIQPMYTMLAVVFETLRVPQTTIREINFFVEIALSMSGFSFDFRKTLFSQASLYPSENFKPIDIFAHRIFLFYEECNRHNLNEFDEISMVDCIFRLSKFGADFSKGNILDDISLFAEVWKVFEKFKSKAWPEHIHGQAEILFLSIKNSLKFLCTYLSFLKEGSISSEIVKLHFFCTFFLPFDGNKKLSETDLLPIKQTMQFLANEREQGKLQNNLRILKKIIKKYSSSAKFENKLFWQLNATYANLAAMEMMHSDHIYNVANYGIQRCQNIDEVRVRLLALDKKVKSSKVNDAWGYQLSLLHTVAVKENLTGIVELLVNIDKSWSRMTVLKQPILDILSNISSETSNETPIPQIKSVPMITKESESSEEEISSIEDSLSVEEIEIVNFQTYQPSSLEQAFDTLNQLKLLHPPLIQCDETPDSYYFRTAVVKDFILNCQFYRILIEESEKWNLPSSFKTRNEIDRILLLETTEKTAISLLPLADALTPNNHIMTARYNNRPLKDAHDGVYLTDLISKCNASLFSHFDIQDAIHQQDSICKKFYWFQEKCSQFPNTSMITKSCEMIWQNLAGLKNSEQPSAVYEPLEFRNKLVRLHKLKRKQAKTAQIPVTVLSEDWKVNILKLLGSLKTIPECKSAVNIQKSVMETILDFHQSLSSYVDKKEIPLFFAMRSAEIQIGLLSTALKLALSTVKLSKQDPSHVLFLDHNGTNEDRPLIHCHNVNKLWKVLRGFVNENKHRNKVLKLDTYLSLYAGDPRYPFPNKSVITNKLVGMYEKVYLHEKIETNGFFSEQDNLLLTKHLGKENKALKSHPVWKNILEKKISLEIEEQNQKTLFALQLVETILSLSFETRI